MSDTKTPGDKTLHVSPKTLSLPKRPVEQNMVRQSFSHGRSKAVVVETVKRRAPVPGQGTPVAAAPVVKQAVSGARPTLGLGGARPQPPAEPVKAVRAGCPPGGAGRRRRTAARHRPSDVDRSGA